MYEKIFYSKLNLGLKPPHKDTCKLCDTLAVKIRATEAEPDSEQKVACLSSLKTDTELHHRRVELARTSMLNDKKAAIEGKCSVLTFDLQKTIMLPKVPTGVVYYKRQLACYNLGIHNCATSKGTMHLWHEGVAGQGPDEIGSCLLKYLSTFPSMERLVLWSDSCGGQNRNIKLVVLLMCLVSDPSCSIKEVTQKFAIPGHSYLPNDSDFGHIEKKMMKQQHIFTLDEVKNIIETCRVKKEAFDVMIMKSSDFYRSNEITHAITNRKQHDGKKVSWLNIRVLRVSREKPFVMEYKYSHNEDIQFEEVSFAKRLKGIQTPLHKLVLKQTQPKPIKDVKKKDIESMLPFVPPVYHTFYHSILAATTQTASTLCATREISNQENEPNESNTINCLQSCAEDPSVPTETEDREEYWDSEQFEENADDDPTWERKN
ncbi:uncharacterized protein LOC134536634 [Bacillus rossius redtenbacheri]|uniref:uncharacterized protein LOC134536634 n=1 Tax=Bacillus rossius redtenbacheri TaxID=93214 RepID=UPI002FDE120C